MQGKRRLLPTHLIPSCLGALSKGCTEPAWLNMASTCWTDAVYQDALAFVLLGATQNIPLLFAAFSGIG